MKSVIIETGVADDGTLYSIVFVSKTGNGLFVEREYDEITPSSFKRLNALQLAIAEQAKAEAKS